MTGTDGERFVFVGHTGWFTVITVFKPIGCPAALRFQLVFPFLNNLFGQLGTFDTQGLRVNRVGLYLGGKTLCLEYETRIVILVIPLFVSDGYNIESMIFPPVKDVGN